ncbi:M23 family metallopeptidase [Methylotuvimicrobium alcaliphilum]|uniref:Peptidase M23 n=1 Tax=Methylotuvimicrobium alcaliphilum (strain DSM 19304 / NCIMB 14124 / VKM B-2133 / 20Z) TaxID=1091494 RepID=G4SVG1_META2|nr:M23 family metallopeptidase [Methylotuvimicrobium alcaliphilum]CCE22933.1 Peptidase M23 [Methylotuvimicrobium alcaliphilum 20Z]
MKSSRHFSSPFRLVLFDYRESGKTSPFALRLVPALVGIIWVLFSFNVAAKKLYQYQDERGIWHYTDKAPDTELPVTIRQLKVEQRQKVWLIQGGDKRHPTYAIRNDYGGPVQVEVDFVEQENALANPALPHRFIVPPGLSKTLLEISEAQPQAGFRFTVNYRYAIGPPLTDYLPKHAYLPPFAAGESFQITQGFEGEFSHTDPENRYAVDIAMPVGTPIHAARSGVVMDVERDFFEGGVKPAYGQKANRIRILHDDGSMAVYAHLELEKTQVYPGLRVEAGQLIAYSGNTGFTTGPHLHFAVQINSDMALTSVPFVFLSASGVPKNPVAGIWLRGVTATQGGAVGADSMK